MNYDDNHETILHLRSRVAALEAERAEWRTAYQRERDALTHERDTALARAEMYLSAHEAGVADLSGIVNSVAALTEERDAARRERDEAVKHQIATDLDLAADREKTRIYLNRAEAAEAKAESRGTWAGALAVLMDLGYDVSIKQRAARAAMGES